MVWLPWTLSCLYTTANHNRWVLLLLYYFDQCPSFKSPFPKKYYIELCIFPRPSICIQNK